MIRLLTRSLYAPLNTRNSWSDRLSLDSESLGELHSWYFNLKGLDFQPLWRQPGAVRIVYSDASDTGHGGYTVEHGHYVALGH